MSLDHYRSAPTSPSGGQRGAVLAEAASGWRSKSMDRLADGTYAAQVVLNGVRSKLQQEPSPLREPQQQQQQQQLPISRGPQAGAAASAGAQDQADADRQFQQQQANLQPIHLQGKQPDSRGTAVPSSSTGGANTAESHSADSPPYRVNSLTAEWPSSPMKISAKKNVSPAPAACLEATIIASEGSWIASF